MGGEGPDLESFIYKVNIQQSSSLEVFASDARNLVSDIS